MEFSACFFTFLFAMIMCHASGSNVGKLNMNLDVDKNFIRSKRIPLKSIKSPDGDIIDCINIYEQPAFDHPLLKNHIIQMTPSYYPEGVSPSEAKPNIQLWQSRGRCPEGTIPIRRDDRIRSNSNKNYGRKQPRNLSQSSSSLVPDQLPLAGHEYAITSLKGGRYHGAKATLNVWQPKVQVDEEFSISQIWVAAGGPSDLNTVEAGWQVYPHIYKDNNTRFFVYWTSDSYRTTGCYNLICPGFVQTSTQIVAGGVSSPVSTYRGNQFEATIVIWKDTEQKSWWLSIQNITIGYWPDSLYTYLADTASIVEWGGEIVNTKPDGKHTTTQMGSGHFAEELDGGAAYFKNLQLIDEFKAAVEPVQSELRTSPDTGCYNILLYKNSVSGNFFFYGGPGRNPFCL